MNTKIQKIQKNTKIQKIQRQYKKIPLCEMKFEKSTNQITTT